MISFGTLRQVYATFTVNLGLLGFGTVIGWTSLGLESESLKNDIPLRDKTPEWRWTVSIVHPAALFSCLLGAFILDRIGRIKSMIIFTFPFIIGWIVIMCAKNVAMIYTGRFLLGFAGGFFSAAGPVFVGEIAHEKIRGVLSNGYGLFFSCGLLISYILGCFVNWWTMCFLCGGIPVLLLVLLFTIPETPRYYLQIGKHKEAHDSLCWYRGVESDWTDVDEELNEMEANIEEVKKESSANPWRDLIAPGVLRPFVLSVSLYFFEQLSGYPAIVAYSGEIFSTAKLDLDYKLMTILFGIAEFLATVASTFIVDSCGRRPLLIISQLFSSISLAVLGVFYHYHDKSKPSFAWVPLVSLIVYISSASAGIGPISTTLMGEFLPQNVRGIGSAICTAVLRAIAFSVAFGFDLVKHWAGIQYCFWAFSFISISSVIFSYFLIPETKGKTLDEIRQIFLDRSAEPCFSCQTENSSHEENSRQVE